MSKKMRAVEAVIASLVTLSIVGSFFGIPSPFVGCANTQNRQSPHSSTDAQMPTWGDAENVNVREAPSRDVANNGIRTYLCEVLKDPESLRLRIGTIQKGYYNRGLGGQNKYAWRVNAGVNAKNSYGGYTGEKPHHFYFIDNRLVAIGTYEKIVTRYRSPEVYIVVENGSGGLTAGQAMTTSSDKISESSNIDVPEEPFDP